MNAPKFSSSPQAATSFSYSPNSNLDTNEPKAHSGQLQATSADEIENMLADGRRSPILIVDDEPFVADLMFHCNVNADTFRVDDPVRKYLQVDLDVALLL